MDSATNNVAKPLTPNQAIEALKTGRWLTELRLKRIFICCAILFTIAYCIEIWLHLHLKPGINSPINFPLGEDFANQWSGSLLSLQGQAAKAYDLNAFLAFEHRNLPPFSHFRWFAYPPTALLLFLPVGLFPYLTAYFLWLGAGFAATAAVLRRFLSWRSAILIAICTPASFDNAVAGQNGAFTSALIAAGIILLEENSLLAALAICLLCFKPHLAILFPVALIAARRWRVLIFATIGCAAFLIASLEILGREVWTSYLHIAPFNRIILEHGGAPGLNAEDWAAPPMWYRMPTIFGAVRDLHLGVQAAYISQIVSSIFAIGLVWWAWRKNVDFAIRAAIFVLATFAVTPYAWDYDLVVLTFAVVWLWQRGYRAGYPPYEKTLLACLMASTLVGPSISLLTHFPMQIFLIWALLICLAWQIRALGRSSKLLESQIA